MDDALQSPPLPHPPPGSPPPLPEGLALRVLASGSAANCSILLLPALPGQRRTVVLLDLGLSPRRLAAALAAEGLDFGSVAAVLLTHLDSDHCHPGWYATPAGRPGGLARLPASACLHLCARQHGPAVVMGLPGDRLAPFDGEFPLAGRLTVTPEPVRHDRMGSTAFRVADLDHNLSLGFATDVGRVTPGLVSRLAGVSVLAIESNYCPDLQAASDRPEFLKHRIMGGWGHLSNGEALHAVRRIAPRHHVVLLHLSRQCNRPDLAAAGHHAAPYQLTISLQDEPTPWIPVLPVASAAVAAGRELQGSFGW